MSFAASVSVLALVVSLTAAIPGIVLVLRRQAMLSDALSRRSARHRGGGALDRVPGRPALAGGRDIKRRCGDRSH